MRFFTREAMQEIDRQAVTLYGMSVMALMEFAGWSVAISAGALAAGHSGAVFTIVCGPGNNGGDGLVAARWGYPTLCWRRCAYRRQRHERAISYY